MDLFEFEYDSINWLLMINHIIFHIHTLLSSLVLYNLCYLSQYLISLISSICPYLYSFPLAIANPCVECEPRTAIGLCY